MKELVLRYVYEGNDLNTTRAQRNELRFKTTRHQQTQANLLTSILTCLPKVLFSVKQALGFGRRAPIAELMPPVQKQRTYPTYVVQGVKITRYAS